MAENTYFGPKDQMETRRPSEQVGDQRPSQKVQNRQIWSHKAQLATLTNVYIVHY